MEAQCHASAAVWRYAACPMLRYAFAVRRGRHVVCRGMLRVLGGLGAALGRGLSEQAPGGGTWCPGVTTVWSPWMSSRRPWPELWAGLGSLLHGIAHHISMCDMDTYGARVMGFMRVYCIPNLCSCMHWSV